MSVKRFMVRLHWLLAAQFGLDIRIMIRSMRGVPRFLRDWRRFRAAYSGQVELVPCLHDWYAEAGSTQTEYFWQDLIVARMIFSASPAKHVDVGSRIDGFVAHVASFRDIEVFDVRPVLRQVPGVTFTQADLTSFAEVPTAYCDSLSCLHALEHFGLGRYGDRVDVMGLERGLTNLGSLLQADGLLYLSLPIGVERVEFNANRVCDPRNIVKLAARTSLAFQELIVIGENGGTIEATSDIKRLSQLAAERYALGLFKFSKIGNGSYAAGPQAPTVS